jgi:hypothetical protein
MTDELAEDGDYFFGLDFLVLHGIRHDAWDLGTHQGRHGLARSWAIRLERQDDDGRVHVWTWTRTVGANREIDWDDVIWEVVSDARDGRLTFDALMDEDIGAKPDITIRRVDYEMWVTARHVWQEARTFLDWDAVLIKSFLSVVPNEI